MRKTFTLLLLIFCLALQTKAQSLLAHFPLTTNGNDTTGNGNSTIINDGVFSGGGVYFKGTYQTSFGQTNDIEGLKSTPFSISCDFKIDGTFGNGIYPVFVDGGNRLAALTIVSNGSTMKAAMFANDNAMSDTSTKIINPNQWYNGKLNYDRKKLSLYIDDVWVLDMPIVIVNRNGGATSNAIYSQNTANGKAFKGWWKNLKVYGGPVKDTSYTLNATLQQISTPSLVAVGNTNINGKIQNNGTTDITSFDVTYTQNATTSSIYSVKSVSIKPGAFYSFTHDVPKNFPAGINYLKVAISNINGGADNYPADDSLAKNITARYLIDATAATLNNLKYMVKGNNNIIGTIKNNGLYNITSFDVTYTVDGGAASAINSVGSINIPYGKTIDFTHNVPANLSSGQHTIAYTISNVNGGEDGFTNDNSISKAVVALTSAPVKRVYAEEGTGTWCSWCPRGTVYMDSMRTKYPTTFIGVAVHGGSASEPMMDTVYANGMAKNYFGSFPGIAVDRQPTAKGVDPNVVESFYKSRIVEPSPVDVSIGSITYDPATRHVDYKVTAVPTANMTVNWNFNSVVYEDDVTWSSPSDSNLYRQSNYYAQGAYGVMGGFEKKSNPVPAKDMHYNLVARSILDGFLGLEGRFPTTVMDGYSYTKTYSYTIPATYDANQIHLIGMVTDATTKEVLNVVESAHEATWYPTVGIEEEVSTSINLYPNPTTGKVFLSSDMVEKVEVYNVFSQLLFSERNARELDLSMFVNGAYFLRLFDEKQNMKTMKVLLNK